MLTVEKITKPIQIIQYHGDEDLLLVPDYVSSSNLDLEDLTLSLHNNAVVLLTAQDNIIENGMYKYTGTSLVPYYFSFFQNVKKIYKVTEESTYLIYNGPTDNFNQFYTISKNDVIIIINKAEAPLPYEWYSYNKIYDPKVRFNQEIILNNFCALGTSYNDKTDEIILNLNNLSSYPIVLTSEVYNTLSESTYHVITDIIQSPDIDYRNIFQYDLEEGGDYTIDSKGNLVINQQLVSDGLNGQGKLNNWRILSAADPNFLSNNYFLIKSLNKTKLYFYNATLNNPYIELTQDVVKYPFSVEVDSDNIVYEKRNLIQNNIISIPGISSSTYINSAFYIQKTGPYEVRVRLYDDNLVLLSEDRFKFSTKQLLNLPTPTPTPTPSSKKHTVVFDAGPRLVIDNCEDCYKDFLSATVTNMSEESRYYYEFGVHAYGNANPDEPRDTTNTDDISFVTNNGIINNGNTTENIRTLMTTGIGKIRTTLYIKVINLDNYVTSTSYLTLEKCDRDFCATTPTPTASKSLKSYPPRTPTKTKTPTPTQTSTSTPTPTPTPTTPLTPPGEPTDLVAVAGNTLVNLSWVAPAASIIRDYTIQYSSDSGSSWTTFNDGTSINTSVVVTGLVNGTPYLFRVAATNGAGSGSYATTLSPVSPIASPPAAPTVTSVTGGDAQASISWTVPNNGGAAITDYLIQYSNNVGASWTNVTRAPSTLTTATITGLTNGVSYIFRVAAVNSAGTGQYSINSASTIPATLPAAPTSLFANLSGLNINLSWTAPSNNGGATITDYAVQYASSSSSYATWVQVNDGVSSATSATITGLTFGQSYIFRVAAINRVGGGAISSSTSPLLFAAVPSAPSAVSGTITSNSIDLSWSTPQSNGSNIIDYTIQISNDNGVSWSNVSTNTVSNSINIASPTVAIGPSYVFRVAARNSIGLGAYTNSSSIIIYPQGSLLSWGDNSNSNLGDGFRTNRSLPAPLGISWSQIFLGGGLSDETIIALTTDGKLYGWGNNANGLTGIGSVSGTTFSPTRIGSASNWTQVFIGDSHALAINSNGELWGWGSNWAGQLGNGSTSTSATPMRIGTASNWVKASVGTTVSAAINSIGELWVAGTGFFGTGADNPVVIPTFTKITPPTGITGWSDVTIGGLLGGTSKYYDNFIVAISTDGKLFAAGVNSYGQTGLGLNNNLVTTSFTRIGSSSNWVRAVSRSYANHVLAVNSAGQLWAWGRNDNRQLGDGTTNVRATPIQVGSSSNWLPNFIVTSIYSSMAINSLGELYGWGYNSTGLLGDGTSAAKPVTTRIETSQNYNSLSMSPFRFSMTIKNNTIYYSGQSTSASTNSFTQYGSNVSTVNANNFTQIDSGSNFAIATNSSGQQFSWGANSSNVANQGPRLSSVNGIKKIAAGFTHYLVLDTGSNLFVGGSSGYHPASSNYINLTSVRINSSTTSSIITNVKKIAAGANCSFYIDVNDRAYAAGLNTNGVLGVGTNTTAAVGFAALSLVGGVALSCRDIFTSTEGTSAAAITTNGELYTWGNNNFGQLGLGDTTNRNAPLRVGAQNNWTKIAIGNEFMIGLNSLGQLWAWGNNLNGQLGTEVGAYSFVPVRIGSASNWTDIAAGVNHALAINSTGQLWAWGSNNIGQLGDDTFVTRYVPVRIGASYTWLSISAGGNFSIGIID